MDRQEELRQWFSIANDDLRSAEYLSTMHYPTPDGIICFLSQQSAEKYLKGFLFKNNVELPKIHNLLKLLEMCEQIVPEFGSLLKQSSFLNKYAVTPRYPEEIEITSTDVKTAIQYAKNIQVFVNEHIGKANEDNRLLC